MRRLVSSDERKDRGLSRRGLSRRGMLGTGAAAIAGVGLSATPARGAGTGPTRAPGGGSAPGVPGKYGDLVILDQDYRKVPDEGLKPLRSALTVVNGHIVHRASPFR
jgi:hypothetical protein